VRKPDEKKSFYEITDKGRDYLENPPEEIEGGELERSTEEKQRGYDRMTEDITEKTRPETVPSQSDLFKSIGERLRIGVGTGGERKGRERGRARERKEGKETDEGRE